MIMDQKDYNNILSGVIEETQSCEKVKVKSRNATKLILLVIMLAACVTWIVMS